MLGNKSMSVLRFILLVGPAQLTHAKAGSGLVDDNEYREFIFAVEPSVSGVVGDLGVVLQTYTAMYFGRT